MILQKNRDVFLAEANASKEVLEQNAETVLRGKSSSKIYWKISFVVLALISAILLITMDVAPYLYSDEFMIVDLGRVILHPSTNWSIAWLTNLDKPVFLWSYIGPVLQELNYEMIGQYGPRIFAILGGIAAEITVVAWLLSRGTQTKAAFILGFIFLLDPIFVQAFTMGRVDAWAIAFCIASCWLLRKDSNFLSNRILNRHIFLSGSFAVVAFFVWPSALFLYPLILSELIILHKTLQGNQNAKRRSFKPFFTFFFGGLIAVILLLIPIIPHLFFQIQNIIEGFKTNVRSGPSNESKSVATYALNQFIEIFRVLKFSPIIILLALISFIVSAKRQIALLIALATSIFIMILTVVYIHRVLYLLPYFMAFAANLFQVKRDRNISSILEKVKKTGLGTAVAWAVFFSLLIRTTLALNKTEERNRQLVYDAARALIGEGHYKVLIIPYEFYYPGRLLGWEMYKPYLAQNDPLTAPILKQVLPHVDFVITHHLSEMTGDFVQQLNASGFTDKGIYEVYDKPLEFSEQYHGITTNNIRVRNLYSIFRKPYGPYKLFVRRSVHAKNN